jgi:hypothetical protein
MLERALTGHEQEPEAVQAWLAEVAEGGDPELASRLTRNPDPDELFGVAVRGLAESLVRDAQPAEDPPGDAEADGPPGPAGIPSDIADAGADG